MSDPYNYVEIESVYRVRSVIESSEGIIEISPDPDGLNLVHIKATDTDHFGKIDATMNYEAARALANALLKAADDAEREENK